MDFIKVACIVAPYGIGGMMRVKLFTENLSHYDVLYVSKVTVLHFKVVKIVGNGMALLLTHIRDRSTVERMSKKSLYVPRNKLKKLGSDEYLIHDLIGKTIRVYDTYNDECYIVDIKNYGATDLIEVKYNNKQIIVPFIRDYFPDTDDKSLIIAKRTLEMFL